MSIKFLDLKKQYLGIKNEIDTVISDVILESSFIGGKRVEKFENDFSNFLSIKNCVGVANGTDALEIAIEALNLKKNSEIIVPVNSWISSAEAVSRSGHKVVFCDANKDDYLIDISDLEKKITNKTSAIMPVHLYGQICDMNPILDICKKNNIKIIEDCAQSHGAEYNGKKAGTFGDIGCFSFYPGKNLGAYGDGGAIVTNNNDLALKSRMIANHGRTTKFGHQLIGRNSRLDSIQAAILSVKIKYLDEWIEKRNLVASIYKENLQSNNDVILPKVNNWSKHAFHLYVIRHTNRETFIKYLNTNGIEIGIHYPTIISKTEAYKKYKNLSFSISDLSDHILSIPIGEHLSNHEVEKVCKIINEYK